MSQTAKSPKERQRRRRQRLREAGFVDVTVTVPEAARSELRDVAQALFDGRPVSRAGSRLPAVIRGLRAARGRLEALGVAHAGVFGSVARGDDRPDSDVDIAIDIDPARIRDAIEFIEAVEAIRAALPGERVEVADRRTLKPALREAAERDRVDVF